MRILKGEIHDKETVKVRLVHGKPRGSGGKEDQEERLEVVPNHEAKTGGQDQNYDYDEDMDVDVD